MPERRLRETLDELHRELESTESVEAADRAALERVARDLHELLDREEHEPEEHESLLDQLREATQRFEEEHPSLTAAINRVATALSNIGI